MPYIIAIMGLLGAAYFWMMRARNAAEMTHELADIAGDVMAAARRFGFRRRHNTHPVESIEDPQLCIGALGVAFLQLGGMPTTEQKAGLLRSLQSRLNLNLEKAEELDVLGQWFVNECKGPQPAVQRISKRLYTLTKSEHLEVTMGVVTDTVAAGSGDLSERQREALHDVKRAFHVT